jgi:hypothetical protein
LAELEEIGIGLILGYRLSSYENFLLALIHPPLVAFSDPSICLVSSCFIESRAILIAPVNILTQLTIKKGILHIKLRDKPLPNRSHSKKSVNSGHMSNRSKSLIIIPVLLLLKTMSNKTSLIALKRTIRASLILIDPFTSDRMNTWGIGHKIPRASQLKSSNLLSHRVLPFQNRIAL